MLAYAEGLNIPEERRCQKQGERDQDAETAPLEHPEFYQYDMDLTKISEVHWRRGSVVGSWLLDLTAMRCSGSPTSTIPGDAFRTPVKAGWTSIACNRRRRSRRRG